MSKAPLPTVSVHALWLDTPAPHLAVSITEAARITALGRTEIYSAIFAGHIVAVKAEQGRILVLMDSLRAYLGSLPRLKLKDKPPDEILGTFASEDVEVGDPP